jgi:glucose/arabinose dehydrogenase
MSLSRPAVLAAVVVALSPGGPVPVSAEPAQQEWRVTTVAGMGASGYSGDGGPATEARLGGSPAYDPRLAVAADGTLYLAEWVNHRLRRVTPDGVITTVPGTVTRNGSPRGVAIAGDGAVYLATDVDIRRIDAAGSAQVAASETLLTDLDVDRAGNVYYANHFYDDAGLRKAGIVRLDRAGGSRTLVDDATEIHSIAVDAAGTVYYTTGDMRPDSGTVHAVGADGARRTAATLPAGHLAGAVTIAPDGAPHVVDVTRGQILRIDGPDALPPVGPTLTGGIDDLAFGPDGTPYVVAGATVRRLDRVTEEVAEPRRAASPWADEEPGTVHRVLGNGAEPATTAPGLGAPAVGADGTVYVAEPRRNLVHAIDRDGHVTRFAAGTDLAGPYAVAADQDGNVHIATRTAILRVARDGRVSTVTEVDSLRWRTDRPDLMPQLAVDGSGTVFYAENAGPLEGVIRSMTGDGPATTIAGTDPAEKDGLLPGEYSENKPATDATLRLPSSVAVGADGTVYVIETRPEGSIHGVRAVRPDGVLVTVAGNIDDERLGSGDFTGDGGPAAKAELNNPRGVATGPDGAVYIADTYNGRVRRVSADGVITTIAGTGRRAETGDEGPATEAALLDPSGVAVGGDGTVYVTSAESTKVRAIAPDGTITTLADLHVPPAEIPLAGMDKLAAGPDGTTYVGHPNGLVALAPDGSTTRVQGLSAQGPVATGPDGSVYQLVPEYTETGGAENQRAQLWRRHPDGTQLREAADDPLTGARDLAVGPSGEVYVATTTELTRLGDEPLTVTGEIQDITVAADGTPYLIADNQVSAVRKGELDPVAGNGEEYSADEAEDKEDGGPARDASLNAATAVAATGDGTVFIATGDGLRRVRGGVIETLDSRTATQLAITPAGDLYLATDTEVFAMVRPAQVTIDRTSWTWLWYVGGAVVLLAAAGALVLRHRKRTPPDEGTV